MKNGTKKRAHFTKDLIVVAVSALDNFSFLLGIKSPERRTMSGFYQF